MKIQAALLLLFSVVSTNAQTNYVLNFNGSTDYVDLGSSVASNVRSVELWFNPTSTITSATTGPTLIFVGRNDANQTHEFGLTIHGSDYPQATRGQIDFYLSDNGSYHYALSNNNSWTAGTWYHVAGVIDPVLGMRLYINGVLQTSTDSYNASIPAAPEITAIARWGNANMRYFPGKIDEVRLWNRAISQTEITQKMCYWLNPANETGLIGYWKMNEGAGTTINDASVSGQNGSVIGATFVGDPLCFTGVFGITEHASSQIRLVPNPANDKIIIENLPEPCHFELRNMVGQLVACGTTVNDQINISHFEDGCYQLILNINGLPSIQKLVIDNSK